MDALRLNVDVLTIVCEFLIEVSDILSLSLACFSVHVIAVRLLLLTHPIYLKNKSSIHSFYSFLFVDVRARAPRVRVLHINLGWPHVAADDCSLLLDILAACNRLENLTLAFEQVSLNVISNPRFIQAITAIPSPHSFSLRSYSVDALTLLPELVRTPLRMVGIHCTNVPVSSRLPVALEQFLPRVIVPTLEKLELDMFAVDPHDILAPVNLLMLSILDMTPYLAVRSLLVGSFRGKPLLARLRHLFPTLDGTLRLGRLDIRHGGEEIYADIRAANLHSQESDAGGVSHAWKKLDRVICDAPMLYVLGLRCPIRLAMIEFGLVADHGRYAAEALRENPVPRLKLSVNHDLGPAFGELFSPELAETLTHFTLCLVYSKNYGFAPSRESGSRYPWDHVLGMIVSAIKPLHKLTHLRVVVGVKVYVYKNWPSPFAPLEEYAHFFRGSGFDWEGTAAALAHDLPSLQNVFLTSGGFLSNWDEQSAGCWKPYERWCIAHGWRVANSGSGTDGVPEGGRSLVELHSDVAETIIRNEELVLSELDEAGLRLNLNYG